MNGTLTLEYNGEILRVSRYFSAKHRTQLLNAWEKEYSKNGLAKALILDEVDPPRHSIPEPEPLVRPPAEYSNSRAGGE